MNFFDHQDAAKRATRRLVVLFVLSLIGVGVLLYVPVAIAMASEAPAADTPRYCAALRLACRMEP